LRTEGGAPVCSIEIYGIKGTHHFHRVAFLVADALQVRQQVLERDLFARSQRQRKLPVKLRRLSPEQGRGDRRDGDGGLSRRQPP
jgi:hypothetical protein